MPGNLPRRHGKAGCADVLCLHRSAVGIEDDSRITELGHPALILTSPPYPGVHVLYHRWQVLGRRETPAPFWIAGTLDGAGASYYTFGDRKNVPRYYELAREAFASVARLSSRKTVVAQMVAFSEPEWQLPSYLEVMQDSGFKEISFPSWQIAETVASGVQSPIANGMPTRWVPPLAAKK